jgi:hypothetical protein
MTDKTAADVLRDAAEYIGEHGWIQGDLEDDATGSVCAIGAINRVQDNGWHDHGALEALRAYLRLPPQVRDFILHPVAVWNDEKERTAEDVILAMKRTAEELER